MSYTFTCDWCGEEIRPGCYVELRSKPSRDAEESYTGGWLGHYHATRGRNCYGEVRDVLKAAQGHHRELAALPVAERTGNVVRFPKQPGAVTEGNNAPSGPTPRQRDASKAHNEAEPKPCVGALIRALRHSAKLSQENLGALFDPPIGQARVSMLELGRNEPTAEQIRQLADALVGARDVRMGVAS